MRTYTTISGDVWDNIAKEVYGSEAYTSFLMENNPDKTDYFVFPSGVVLKIADVPDEQNAVFPEWRS